MITSIHKKWSRKKCENYRGISVISTVSRLYGRVLKGRIEREFKESEEQNGFRAGRSCIDGVLTIKNVIDKKIERKSVHLVFVDLQKVYDTVSLNKLLPCLERQQIPRVYIHEVKKLYAGAQAQ